MTVLGGVRGGNRTRVSDNDDCAHLDGCPRFKVAGSRVIITKKILTERDVPRL